ncbi:unnamed protein product [Rotaria sordida]|uniref:Helicase XPB/Ssl2 N-terminal domain-containing protein n=1 Tax=Rotaria sordida TaxID=392033 RepID=A0A813WEG1_9BILA|nr:unnamed protein product [Rotaria sordida]CAF0860044.1 unnamed protein product [Rotaria sordida]CAF1001838.1 unnamed protein product [Rotaria sordida]CAF1085935.1 unnamed protein product [Rotaria sordida]CAF3828233.1 unnamed protein product [Rotaria sordida]
MLTFHAHQVISLKCYDTIRDRSSIISLLFNRHHFINLQSCIFISDNPSTELENAIKQVESLNRLISFFIIQLHYKKIHEKDKCDITRTILMNKSSSLRSVKLIYNYDYSNISTYTSIASNIRSLELLISADSLNKISVYSILLILRVCHRIRYLYAIIKHEIPSENNNLNVSIEELFLNENDLPISPQVTSFDLSIFAQCDIRSIVCILRLNSVQSNDNDDSQQYVTSLSHIVHLPNKLSTYSLYAAVSIDLQTNDIIEILQRLSRTTIPNNIIEFIKLCTLSYGKNNIDINTITEKFQHLIPERVLTKENTTTNEQISNDIRYLYEKIVSFEVNPNKIELLQKRCQELEYPLLDEYDLHHDTILKNLNIEL